MILKSSRKDSAKFIAIVSSIFGICFILYIVILYGHFIKALIGSTFLSLFIFCAFALCLLPIDITADDKYIYIHKYFKKYKVPFIEVKMVELYIDSASRGAPAIRITKDSGEQIIQGIGVLNHEKTELLISILNLHNIKIYYTKLD